MMAKNASQILQVLSDIIDQHANETATHATNEHYSSDEETCSSCSVLTHSILMVVGNLLRL